MQYYKLNKLSILVYSLNILISTVLPIMMLLIIHMNNYALYIQIGNVSGFVIIVTLWLSVLIRNRFLHSLNVFSTIILINSTIKTNLPFHLVEIIFALYSVITLILFYIQLLKPHLTKKLLSVVEAHNAI
jgi:hypothetical protein